MPSCPHLLRASRAGRTAFLSGMAGTSPAMTNEGIAAMRIATFNVNSVKQRVEAMQRWLKERAPDIVCLQEIKCVDEAFPRSAFEDLGYNVAVHGQKSYNGVAILSKFPLDEVAPQLPGDQSDVHARYLEAVISVA